MRKGIIINTEGIYGWKLKTSDFNTKTKDLRSALFVSQTGKQKWSDKELAVLNKFGQKLSEKYLKSLPKIIGSNYYMINKEDEGEGVLYAYRKRTWDSHHWVESFKELMTKLEEMAGFDE